MGTLAMTTLLELVKGAAAPILSTAGYRRRGCDFIVDGPGGQLGVVDFSTDNRGSDGLSGFSLTYGVVVPQIWQWRASIGMILPAWPNSSEALLFAQVFHPVEQPSTPTESILPYRWIVPEGPSEYPVEQYLRSALETEVLPTVQAWLVPRTLARVIRNRPRGVFLGASPPPRAEMFALMQEGHSPELERTLAELDKDDPIRVWVEAQFTAEVTQP